MSIFKFLFSEIDDSSKDKLGAYPEKVHVRAMPERRYLKTSRIMTFVSAGLLCFAIILTFVIYLLSPQLRSEATLLRIDRRFYKLENVERHIVRVPASQLLTEEHIKQYIILRHTIVSDVDEMQIRWDENNSMLKWFSSNEAFRTFIEEKKINMIRIGEGLTVEVNVRFVHRIAGGLWLSEFETIEHTPEEEYPTVKRWRALLEIGFHRRPYPTREEHFKNPLNFYVYKYSLIPRVVTKDDKNARFID
ncbi:MAG: hypothetical protein J5716_08445 [Alphaproteobacteria bacterium]|nr:hypothetical protein [Alphaproteobacteria bacterium]